MALISNFNEDRPVTYIRGYPIYYATILTIAYAVGVLATFISKAAGGLETLISWFSFQPDSSIFQGRIWQAFTYSFISAPSFFTVIGLLFLYVSAVEIERYIGKARFLTLFGFMILIPVVSLTLISLSGFPVLYYGQTEISIGFFIAFCTLYPGLQWGGFFTAKWVAIVSLGIASLSDLAARDWISFLELCLVSGFAFGYIRFLQRGGELPSFRIANPLRKKHRLHVVKTPAPARSRAATEPSEHIEIDPLLDKISRKGLGSLTPAERSALERAREKLIEKDRKRNR
jgi:hypothetical protein